MDEVLGRFAPETSNPWALIPARGGSVGVPRKNVRMLAGKPLILHTIDTARHELDADHIVVVTDDDEIAHVAATSGVRVVLETEATPAGETLDTKVLRNLPQLRKLGARDGDPILTIQPTSPLVTASAMRRAISALDHHASALTVTDDRHLRWSRDAEGTAVPLYEARVNRQEIAPAFKETGGVIAARLGDIEHHGTRVIDPVALIELDAEEAVDIDSFADFYAAAHLSTRLRIVIRTDAAPALGMGHVYRSLAIATELARHELTIVTSAEMPLGGQFFSATPYRSVAVHDEAEFTRLVAEQQPQLIVLDHLDSARADVEQLRARAPQAKIVTFEDVGPGASATDLAVAEFITLPPVTAPQTLTGVANAVLAPAFEYAKPSEFRVNAAHVLVLFGGTDHALLADRALDALERAAFKGQVTVVRGIGAAPLRARETALNLEVLTDVRYMPGVMSSADFAFTSAGRTIVELASLGVPSMCMAQNEKEMTHTHATPELGVRMLGLAIEVSDQALDEATQDFLGAGSTRRTLREAALATLAGRSNHRTIGRMFDMLGFDPFPNL